MNIDWSKAPEGATHYSPKAGLGMRWRRKTAVGWETWEGKEWIVTINARPDLYVARDNSESSEWDGGGLPPEGIVCEYGTGNVWGECKVLHVGALYMLISANGHSEVPIYHSSFCFRPIRTAEQIAADKRLHEIRNALTAIHAGDKKFPNDIVRGNIVAATVEAMIDAGYHKFEIVEEDV